MSLVKEGKGHRSLETSHFSSINNVCRESCEHSSLDTSQSNSINHGGHGCRLSMTIHYDSLNSGGCVDVGGSRLQETSHFFSWNQGTIFEVERSGGYRSTTIHYTPPKQVEHGRMLNFKEILLVVMCELDIGAIPDTLTPK